MPDSSSFIFYGFIGGIISSAPLGPINLQVINAVVAKRGIFRFVAGVIFADMLLAATAAVGMDFIPHQNFHLVLSSVTALLLIGWGILLLSQKTAATITEPSGKRGAVGFLSGFIFCLVNPAFFSFWLLWIGGTVSPEINSRLEGAVSISTGVLLGDSLWFFGLHRASSLISSVSIIRAVQKGTPWLLIGIGILTAIKTIYEIY